MTIPLADVRAIRVALETARRAIDDARDLASRHRAELPYLMGHLGRAAESLTSATGECRAELLSAMDAAEARRPVRATDPSTERATRERRPLAIVDLRTGKIDRKEGE